MKNHIKRMFVLIGCTVLLIGAGKGITRMKKADEADCNKHYATTSALRTIAPSFSPPTRCNICHMEVFTAGGGSVPDENDLAHCFRCHLVRAIQETGKSAFLKHYSLDTFINPADGLIYGPSGNILFNPLYSSSGFNIDPGAPVWVMNPQSPGREPSYLEMDARVFGNQLETGITIRQPYKDWLTNNYSFLRNCQACHVPHLHGVVMASRPVWLDTLRDDLTASRQIGGRHMQLDIFENSTAVTSATSRFKRAAGQAPSTAASISIAEENPASGTLDFTLLVENLTTRRLNEGGCYFKLDESLTMSANHKCPSGKRP